MIGKWWLGVSIVCGFVIVFDFVYVEFSGVCVFGWSKGLMCIIGVGDMYYVIDMCCLVMEECFGNEEED